MRIAFVALNFSEYAWCLAKELAVEHQVLAIFNMNNCQDELSSLPESSSLPNLQILFLPHRSSIRTVLFNTYTLIKAIRKFQPDIVHYQEDGKDCFIFALPWIKNYPFVLTIHDPIPHSGADFYLRRWHRLGLYVRILRRICDVAIVHGNYLKLNTEYILPRLKGRIYVVPHGPLGLLDGQSSRDWEPGNLLFFGRMEAYKGLSYFIAAVQELQRRGLSVKGVIAGRGSDLDRHLHIIDENSLYEIHDGFVTRKRLAELFKRANVVVLPYTDGTQSGVAAMALGYERPVVASKVGSIPEMVRDGVNGYLVPPKDLERLVEALIRLIEDQSVSVKMADNAAMLCNGENSWHVLAGKTVSVYEKAIYFRAASNAS